ncbi:glycosyltransferase family 2 protein [Selenomonas sputigena]|uniref:glycosyltransferase family 2 protein n=1 Tax=Selenomonas sputigena TaxID=69823 RepID=UPI002231CFAE|nr:glycosyltransferase [Selenomonas sputigena]UZD44463.1 glycosyltransferase [Selenomonas sputigena]
MKLSACVITKNEEENIGTWLASMKKIADEMIVVDTGSTDRTVEMAKEAGARVFHHAWQNDFAAAKNAALEKAKGDWILFLDADEHFSPQTLPKVRPLLEKVEASPKPIVGVICRLINIDKDQGNRFMGAIFQLRIFRNSRDLRYEGKIHEHIVDVRREEHEMFATPKLVIFHTGYSLHLVRKKLERNLDFLRQKEEAQGESVDDALHYMDCYYGLGDFARAAEYARKAIASKIIYMGREGAEYWGLVRALLAQKRPKEEILPVLEEAMAKYPDLAEFPMEVGLLAWEERDYLLAEKMFRRGMACRKKTPTSLRADNSLQMFPFVCASLGKIETMKGRRTEAFDLFLRAVKEYPYDKSLFLALYDALAGQEPADVIALLDTLYDRENDAPFLVEALRARPTAPTLLYYARFLPAEKRDEALLYRAAGRTDAAAVELSARLKSFSALLAEAKGEQGVLPEEDAASLLLAGAYKRHWRRKALPLVSIMIPTYNRPQLFELALQSAQRQNYENLEIIVCDNSTDDRTEALIEKYLGDPRLCYHRNKTAKTKEENFAPFEHLAKGEYLQWLMDDDILLDGKIEKMMQAFRKNPAAKLVTSRRAVIDGEGRLQPNPYAAGVPESEAEYSVFDGEIVGRETLLGWRNFLGEPSAVLFRRADLKHHYWRAESRGYKTISDVAMWLELLESGDCVFFQKPLSCYRRHEAQEGQQAAVILLSRLEWLRLIGEYFERRVYIKTEEEYRKPLELLYGEYLAERDRFDRTAAGEVWHEYEAAMRSVRRTLEKIKKKERRHGKREGKR